MATVFQATMQPMMDYFNTKFGELHTALANTNTRIDDTNTLMDTKFGELQTAIADTNTRIDALRAKINNLEFRLDFDSRFEARYEIDSPSGRAESGLTLA